MDWLAETWKWIAANLVNWFVVLWWFTALVFVLATAARWWLWRRWAETVDTLSLPRLFLLGATASWRGDWQALTARYAKAGDERRFVVTLVGALVLPVYTLLMIFAFGKEYLLIYLVAVVVYVFGTVALAGRVLHFGTAAAAAGEPPVHRDVPAWQAPLRELAGVGPRFVAGVVLAGILAAVAIQPEWAFPVEVTGGGLMAQVLNALAGIALAIGAWTPPVAAFLFGVPVWRGGFALAGLLAFLLAIPATPYVLMVCTARIGVRQTARLAALVIAMSLVAALVATALVALADPDLPYVYAPEQLL